MSALVRGSRREGRRPNPRAIATDCKSNQQTSTRVWTLKRGWAGGDTERPGALLRSASVGGALGGDLGGGDDDHGAISVLHHRVGHVSQHQRLEAGQATCPEDDRLR